jgi:hypothetical protein
MATSQRCRERENKGTGSEGGTRKHRARIKSSSSLTHGARKERFGIRGTKTSSSLSARRSQHEHVARGMGQVDKEWRPGHH